MATDKIYTHAELVNLVGPVAADDFLLSPESRKAELWKQLQELRFLSNEDLFEATQYAIHQSALTGRWDLHCLASACAYESQRRNHPGESIYDRAYKVVLQSQGHSA
jgi:hypothetical protein